MEMEEKRSQRIQIAALTCTVFPFPNPCSSVGCSPSYRGSTVWSTLRQTSGSCRRDSASIGVTEGSVRIQSLQPSPGNSWDIPFLYSEDTASDQRYLSTHSWNQALIGCPLNITARHCSIDRRVHGPDPNSGDCCFTGSRNQFEGSVNGANLHNVCPNDSSSTSPSAENVLRYPDLEAIIITKEELKSWFLSSCNQ